MIFHGLNDSDHLAAEDEKHGQENEQIALSVLFLYLFDIFVDFLAQLLFPALFKSYAGSRCVVVAKNTSNSITSIHFELIVLVDELAVVE